jgi:phospholipid-binding lipoprotein MlaA
MSQPDLRSVRALALAAMVAILMSGCATSQAASEGADDNDPLEPVNRAVFAFNDTLDTLVLRPVAKGYDTVAPRPVKTGVANVFDNLSTPIWAANHLLQGEFAEAGIQLGRFAINSTLGLLGMIDAASDAGLQEKSANFSQTFGKWGIPTGPYLMLPFLGPSSVRGAVGLYARYETDIVFNYFDDEASIRDKLIVMGIIDGRRRLLSLDKTRDEAPDEYILVREAYLSSERYSVYGAEDTDVELDFEDEVEAWDEEDADEPPDE